MFSICDACVNRMYISCFYFLLKVNYSSLTCPKQSTQVSQLHLEQPGPPLEIALQSLVHILP